MRFTASTLILLVGLSSTSADRLPRDAEYRFIPLHSSYVVTEDPVIPARGGDTGIRVGDMPRPEEAYRFFDSTCSRFDINLNDQAHGFFICKAAELVGDELATLMDQVRSSDMSELEMVRLCARLQPVARIGHEAFTRGWGPDTVRRAQALLAGTPVDTSETTTPPPTETTTSSSAATSIQESMGHSTPHPAHADAHADESRHRGLATVRAFVPRPETAYRFFESTCSRFGIHLNDLTQGLFICKVQELAGEELVNLMDEVISSDLGELEMETFCARLQPLAQIGNEAFTYGWGSANVQRAKTVIAEISAQL